MEHLKLSTYVYVETHIYVQKLNIVNYMGPFSEKIEYLTNSEPTAKLRYPVIMGLVVIV
jgi:hypothetical protein